MMTEGITWAYEDDSVEEAVVIMSNHHACRLQVLDRNKRLVGIVPFGDLVGGRSVVGNFEALGLPVGLLR
jgi:CBS-domain-containing membrane protein